MGAIQPSGLKVDYRKSHSIINRLPGLGDINLRVFPLDFLITKGICCPQKMKEREEGKVFCKKTFPSSNLLIQNYDPT